jgi:DNA-binding CsgD family transcriptional regulator
MTASDYKVIKDFPNYAITRDGEVFSFRNNIKLKSTINSDGYMKVNLCNKFSRKTIKIHRLIAEYYIDNVNNYPQVNHINGIKTDNRVENLEWCTSSQNAKHAFINKLRISPFGEKHSKAKLTESEVLEIRNSSLSQKELSILYNVEPNTISRIINRKRWKHI